MLFTIFQRSDSMVYWIARPLGIRTIPGSPPLVSKNSFVDKKLGSERKTCTLKFQGNSSSYQTKASRRTEKLGAILAYDWNQASSRENISNLSLEIEKWQKKNKKNKKTKTRPRERARGQKGDI